MAYITLDLAKKHCVVDGCFHGDDEYLLNLIEVAEAVVERDICQSLDEFVNEETGELFKPLQQAALLLVGNYYSNREPVAFAASHKVPESYDALIDRWRNWG
jgi:uncharacterized phage protein (predicted DNA packaging)